MYDNIKKWYDMGLWSAAQVRQAVLKGVISEAQYKEIAVSYTHLDVYKRQAQYGRCKADIFRRKRVLHARRSGSDGPGDGKQKLRKNQKIHGNMEVKEEF